MRSTRPLFKELMAPDGCRYLIGPGGSTTVGGCGPFSIVVYKIGLDERPNFAMLPKYTEAVRHSRSLHERLQALAEGIENGSWAFPEQTLDERKRLERTATRADKLAARQIWVQEHPVASVLKAMMLTTLTVIGLFALYIVSTLVRAEETGLPSPVPWVGFLVLWFIFLVSAAVLMRRHRKVT